MAQTKDIYVIGDGGTPTPGGPGKKLWPILPLVLIILGIGVYFLFFNENHDQAVPAETPIAGASSTAKFINVQPTTPEPKKAEESVAGMNNSVSPTVKTNTTPTSSGAQGSVTTPQLPKEEVFTQQLLFTLNSSSLNNSEAGKIELLWGKIKDLAGSLFIEGHTCSLGTEEFNLELSAQRAKAVAQKLENLGLTDKFTVETKAWGKTRPISNNDTEEGRQKNRRVEITFKSKQ